MSNKTTFHNYVKDGVYEVGEHGMMVWDYTEYRTIVEFLTELDDEDDDLDFGIDFGVGAKILVIRMEGDEHEDTIDWVYKVILLENGDQDTITVECEHHIEYYNTPIDQRDVFYGTDHSIFGSGNIKPLYYLGKIKDEKYLETFYNQYND